jgi:hypothetical protein
MDLLVTKNYERHHKFFFTLVISLLITSVVGTGLVSCEPIYVYLNEFFRKNPYWYTSFLFFTIGNNLYQVYAHIFTGTKFMGYLQIMPHGSRDNQTLEIFTISNVCDILGWLSIFVLHKRANPFLAMLAANHYAAGLVSIFYNKTFQTYYIENVEQKIIKKSPTDEFNYSSWRLFRTLFVFTDAISRGYSILSTIIGVFL